MFSVSRKISLNLSLISGKIFVKSPRFSEMVCNSADCAYGYFWNVMEGSWKVRRKYRETSMEKSISKYEYAEFDAIRVIIVLIATAARLAKVAAL